MLPLSQRSRSRWHCAARLFPKSTKDQEGARARIGGTLPETGCTLPRASAARVALNAGEDGSVVIGKTLERRAALEAVEAGVAFAF